MWTHQALLLVACAVATLAYPLPSSDVSSWSEERVNKYVEALQTGDRSVWWFRVGDRIFSPRLHHGNKSPIDQNINHYWLVMGKEVPAHWKDLVVADDHHHGVHIIHSRHEPTGLKAQHLTAPTKIHNKMELFVDSRSKRQSVESNLDLERTSPESRSPSLSDPDLGSALDTVSSASYMDEIEKITSTGSGSDIQRNVQAAGHTTAEKYLSCRMMQAGLHVQLLPFEASFFKGTSGMDIVGCLPGADKKFVVMGAHYDTLPAPPKKSPGAMDNGSGVGVVMSAMEAMKKYSFQHSVCFTAFDGEELGLLGSHHMADAIAADSNLKSNFLGAVTSDMSTGFKKAALTSRPPGWTQTNSHFVHGVADGTDGIHIDGDEHSKSLISTFASAANEVVTDQKMPVMESTASLWNSDQKAFHSAGLPAIDICSANHRSYEYWHHDHNTTASLDPSIGTEISRTTIAALFNIAGHVGGRDFESPENEDESVLPTFPGVAVESVFKDLDCEQVLGAHEEHVKNLKKSKKTAKMSAKRGARKSSKKNAGRFIHTSGELANQLEEALGTLETTLHKAPGAKAAKAKAPGHRRRHHTHQ